MPPSPHSASTAIGSHVRPSALKLRAALESYQSAQLTAPRPATVVAPGDATL